MVTNILKKLSKDIPQGIFFQYMIMVLGGGSR